MHGCIQSDVTKQTTLYAAL